MVKPNQIFYNLENAKSFTNGLNLVRYRLVIFCDASRALKVKILAETFLSDWDFQVETYDLPASRGETQRQLWATVFEVLALRIPLLSCWHHHQRVKRAE